MYLLLWHRDATAVHGFDVKLPAEREHSSYMYMYILDTLFRI